MIHHFPEWFYLMLRELLYANEYASLCNSSKKYFHSIKRNTVRLFLTYHASCRYCRDQSFRELVHSRVTNPRFQVAMKFMFLFQMLPPNAILQDLYQLRCNVPLTAHQIASIRNVTDVELMNISDCEHFPAIDGCLYLSLRNFNSLRSIAYFPKLQYALLDSCPQFQDVASLAHVTRLSFIRCPLLQDISSLGRQQRIGFTECDLLEDVSTLSKVLTLRIRFCPRVSNISPLSNVTHLEVLGCPLVKDITALTHNYHVVIDACDFTLEGYSALRHVTILRLHECNIQDLHVFEQLHSIELSFCPFVTVVEPLANVYHVTLRSCDGIVEVNALGFVPSLSLINCEELRDISGLGQNNFVKVVYCPKIQDYSSLNTVPRVTIKE